VSRKRTKAQAKRKPKGATRLTTEQRVEAALRSMRRELADEARRDREHADILGCMHGDGNHYWPPPGNQFDQWELTELTRRNDEARDRAKANGQPVPEPMLRLPGSAYEATARHMWRHVG
jgi:hypothetical protein